MQKYLAEFLGSLIFVYVLLNTENVFAYCIVLVIVTLIIYPYSGGHVNPVVSIILASQGKIKTTDLMPYVISQVFGGLVALEIYKKWKI
jgi:glycerol uptake facilitator-like aquaporin|tara:strand:- start:219 stop:485 length:267 start_codon:yes stop_codon:yes gene_type:complete